MNNKQVSLKVSQIIDLLQSPSRTCMYLENREWESVCGGVFKVHSAGHPLKCGELKV